MNQIIFVDDEQKVLDGLRRILRPMRLEWNMKFMTSGQEVLNELSVEPCDILISDIRMPEMNGVELLSKVKEQHPTVIRIALSGYGDTDLMSECTKVAHQFLSKPCEIEQLKSTIIQAGTLKDSLQDQNLLQLISRLESLPSLPSLYQEIQDEFNSANGSIRKVGEIISKDVSMTAKMLQMINSSYYGLSKTVTTAVQAATFLGFDVIKSMVLSIKVFSNFNNKLVSELDINALWSKSAKSSAMAMKIAKLANMNQKDCELAQMSGMVQDVGTLILAENMPEIYSQILKTADKQNIHIWQAELKILGHTHMEIGSYLLRLWGLPKEIVEAVRYHHCPELTMVTATFSPLSAVYIANCLIESFTTGISLDQLYDVEYLATIGVLDKLTEWQVILTQNQELT